MDLLASQLGVGRSLCGIAGIARVSSYIVERLAKQRPHIDLFRFSPDHPEGVVGAFACTSEGRRSRPGMAKMAQAALKQDLTVWWESGR